MTRHHVPNDVSSSESGKTKQKSGDSDVKRLGFESFAFVLCKSGEIGQLQLRVSRDFRVRVSFADSTLFFNLSQRLRNIVTVILRGRTSQGAQDSRLKGLTFDTPP